MARFDTTGWFAAIGLVLLLGSPAAAQPQTDSEARAAFEAGRAAFDTGQYEEALERFEESYALSHEADLLYNIGHTAERLRLHQQALDAFEAYLTARPHVENRQAIEARMMMLRSAVARSDAGISDSVPPEEPSSAGAWALMVGGVATAAAGGVLLAVAAEQANQVTQAEQSSAWSEVSGAYDNSGTYALVGAVLLGAGSVAATVGAVLLLAGNEDAESVQVLVNLNSLSIRGSF